ncbi:gamma-glutamylcyclotransferase family protein [Sphingosinicella sp. BN140058]|uniref:gamma-glutamylcyclotransferase family protein n=1 Tax=Sphingosinicella sp. BN140058 TaxID=1892855 RepID=UPI00101149F0|nr:gamma-glutamylcyclotransferase family protein [Sphingosinicella sp. BN140058]QAY76935.1 gamma-glutamylcyclotransferase [Sphingosinicella sp. BN140058]
MTDTVLLFSYGTLQQPEVQIATFGRRLEGRADALPGYMLSSVVIDDPAVAATSGLEVHKIARRTGDCADVVPGVVFEISPAELDGADDYETDGYVRAELPLASGLRAYVYVARESGVR